MKRYIFLILSLTYTTLFTEQIYESPFSLFSMKSLALGNTNVANADGLESFEYNPAGLAEADKLTLLSLNYSLIANIFQLSEDIVDEYNEEEGGNYETLTMTQIMFYYANLDKGIEIFMDQVDTPYEDQRYPNGFGITPIFSTGFTRKGFGLGYALGLNAEASGDSVTSGEFHSVVTHSLLVGYALPIDLKLFKLDIGVSARPTYKIRGIAPISSVIAYVAREKSEEVFLREIDYLTGLGVGVDAGVKLKFMDLVAGLSLTDIGGTSFIYSENSYESINDGELIGDQEIDDTYFTPMRLNLGLAYNPDLKGVSKVLDPSLSLDYKVNLTDSGELESFERSSDFLSNLSIGADLRLLSFINLRGGLNQGYLTLGLGVDLLFIEVNAAMYSWELGGEPGERQQMGAGIEFALRN